MHKNKTLRKVILLASVRSRLVSQTISAIGDAWFTGHHERPEVPNVKSSETPSYLEHF
jgi:hypothetical protein